MIVEGGQKRVESMIINMGINKFHQWMKLEGRGLLMPLHPSIERLRVQLLAVVRVSRGAPKRRLRPTNERNSIEYGSKNGQRIPPQLKFSILFTLASAPDPTLGTLPSLQSSAV